MIAFDQQNSTLLIPAMDAISTHDLERAKQHFYASGTSVAEWARAKGFNLQLTYSVLSGRLRAKRGQAHHIAVALGLKASHASQYDVLEEGYEQRTQGVAMK